MHSSVPVLRLLGESYAVKYQGMIPAPAGTVSKRVNPRLNNHPVENVASFLMKRERRKTPHVNATKHTKNLYFFNHPSNFYFLRD